MFLIALLAFAILGVLAGILAGLLGIGGGIITVPALYLIFHLLGFPPDKVMHFAIGTSLAAMVFNTLSSTYAHHGKKSVRWDFFKKMLPGVIIGSIIGAFFAHLLPGNILERIFGVFSILLGIYMLWPSHQIKKQDPNPTSIVLNVAAVFISGISNILGIAGGTMTVPAFLFFGMDEKKAIGTSAAVGFVITLMGALSYLYLGLGQTQVQHSVGYLYLPAFVVIAITTFWAAPKGARLVYILEPKLLRRIFAYVLMLVGLSMIFF